jgi:hypothetical protein
VSVQSSVLAPGKQGRLAEDRTRKVSMTWLALAAAAALLVALGAWAVFATRTTTAPATATGGSGHAAPFTSAMEQAISNSAQAAAAGSAARSSETLVQTNAAGRTVRLPAANSAIENATQSGPQVLTISGTNGGGVEYTGIPYSGRGPALIVSGTNGGGVEYTGIPYSGHGPEPVAGGADGGGFTDTGIPYWTGGR